MRVRFRATDAGFDADEFSIVCGVDGRDSAGIEHALSFDRVSEEGAAQYPSEDWGVHTQFDDQSNGGYGCIEQCRLARASLSVDLARQLGGLSGVEGFDVDLAIDDELYRQVRAGLGRVFRGIPGLLVIAEENET